MRKSLSILVMTLIFVIMGTAAMAAEAENVPAPSPSQNLGVVNINTADAAQLSLLPRIGEKTAQRIIEYRREHGNFRKTSDLMQVKGIGR